MSDAGLGIGIRIGIGIGIERVFLEIKIEKRNRFMGRFRIGIGIRITFGQYLESESFFSFFQTIPSPGRMKYVKDLRKIFLKTSEFSFNLIQYSLES